MTPAAWKKGITIGILLVFVLVLGFFAYLACQLEQGVRSSERHDFHYSIDISYSTTIENVTILIPIPELNGTPIIGDMVVRGDAHGVPDGWNLSIEEMNGTPMLAIRADGMVPEYHGYPIPIEPGQSPLPATIAPRTEYSLETPVLRPIQIGMMLHVNRTIETRDPVGREPVFAPDGEFVIMVESARPHIQGMEFVHPVPVYVWFEREQPGEFSLQASIRGINSIWRGGWIFNSFQDSVSVELKEPPGWTEAAGILRTGEGVYYTQRSDHGEPDGSI